MQRDAAIDGERLSRPRSREYLGPSRQRRLAEHFPEMGELARREEDLGHERLDLWQALSVFLRAAFRLQAAPMRPFEADCQVGNHHPAPGSYDAHNVRLCPVT